MKRVLLTSLLAITTLFANAQFKGGFCCGDPDAWFDKEIYSIVRPMRIIDIMG